MVEVDDDVVEIVHPPGAGEARRVLCPRRLVGSRLRVEHGVIDDELVAAVEKLLERAAALGALEDVAFVYKLPRQLASRLAEPVPRLRELLLVEEVLLPLRHPFVV